MTKIPSLLEMLKAGVHFGHQASRWHPKMGQYIFGQRNGVNIIDLEKTQVKLEEALNFLKETAQKGGVILFLGTKKQAQALVKKAAEDCGMPYVTERWLGGTITNFSVISRLLKKLKKVEAERVSGELGKYTKKEQLVINREAEKMDKVVGGIKNLEKIPTALFIVDVRKEETAIREARAKNIPIVAVCDTNVNPEMADYPIPANDDASKSIELILNLASAAVKEGKGAVVKEEKKEEKVKKEKK
ncbi:MAG: 30S ribosomal protein S2 [Patescibacteria group bacterium]|nr:30S ribosomal protein S2 [Patescibacteria group bacterium]MDD5490339.1 30S ribosomal protein S2 [Patescibacteria group bacterium]